MAGPAVGVAEGTEERVELLVKAGVDVLVVDEASMVDLAMMAKLLDALPASRTVQLRTPAFKQHFYGTAPLTATEAFTNTGKARVGQHNDCLQSPHTRS